MVAPQINVMSSDSKYNIFPTQEKCVEVYGGDQYWANAFGSGHHPLLDKGDSKSKHCAPGETYLGPL